VVVIERIPHLLCRWDVIWNFSSSFTDRIAYEGLYFNEGDRSSRESSETEPFVPGEQRDGIVRAGSVVQHL
jgi:hypothetical protein